MNRQILALIVLFIVVSAIPQYLADGQPLSMVPLELGYSVSSLVPIDKGIPVYAVNDELWVRTTNEATAEISLIPPDREEPVVQRTLDPTTVAMLHRFSSDDLEGTWYLVYKLETTNSIPKNMSLPILLVNPDLHDVNPELTDIVSDIGNITFILALDTTKVYDLEEYVFSQEKDLPIIFQIPLTLGSGRLEISKNGEELIISVNGTLRSSLDFWLEFYHMYSYSNTDGTGFISRDIKVATSKPVPILPQTEKVKTSFVEEASLRSGRYTVRMFLRSASGLSTTESKILMTEDGSWIWLDPNSVVSISGSVFSVTSRLDSSISEWPASIYLMYRVNGVESLSHLPIDFGIAKAILIASPWQVKLTDLDVVVSPNSDIKIMTFFNDNLYLLSEKFPLEINYTLSLGHVISDSASIVFDGPFRTQLVAHEVGELSVSVLRGAQGMEGAIVDITNNLGGRINKATDEYGYAVFHVPQGSYLVKASWGDYSETRQVSVENSLSISVTINLPALEDQLLFGALLLIAIVGIATNLWIWVLKPYLRRADQR